MSAQLIGKVQTVNGSADVQISEPTVRLKKKAVAPTGQTSPYVSEGTYFVKTFAPKASSISPSNDKNGVKRLSPIQEIIR